MNKTVLFLIAAAMACACTPGIRVTVENPLDIDRSAELVEIPVAELGAIVPGEGQTYVVSRDGEVIPSQVTHDGLLLFQSSLGGGEKATFTVTAGAPAEFAPRTRGRFAPERYDDFIWENDRVAFRIYGAALQSVDGPSNGIDALYKRTAELILDRWYADSFEKGLSYHDDNGTGLDDYKVGRTLGAGGAAPYIDGELVLNSNFTGHKILDNGPLRTTFRLTYPDLKLPSGAKAAEMRTFSIDAGSQMTRVVEFIGVARPVTVAVGYPMHARQVEHTTDGGVLMICEPPTPKASGVYLGAVLPSPIAQTIEDEGHILAVTTYTPGASLTYYTGLGWEQSGGWDAGSFGEYLRNFAAALGTPFTVTIK